MLSRRADPFGPVLGTVRGSGRADPEKPSLSERLAVPWLAAGASAELLTLIRAGDLSGVVNACVPLAERLSELNGDETPREPQLRVLAALMARLCRDAQADWQALSPELWRFCGGECRAGRRRFGRRQAPLGKAAAERLRRGERLPAFDVDRFHREHQRALTAGVARAFAAGSVAGTFKEPHLRQLAARTYLDAVCVFTGRALANGDTPAGSELTLHRALGKRGVANLRAVLDTYQTKIRAGRFEPAPWLEFEAVASKLTAAQWAHCFSIALGTLSRVTPEAGLGDVRERRRVLRMFIENAMKNVVAVRNPAYGSD